MINFNTMFLIINFTDGNYSSYYVGITNDLKTRLVQHNVTIPKSYICFKMNSKKEAQELEEYCLSLGMQGDTGGGTDESVYVYIYKITKDTIQ